MTVPVEVTAPDQVTVAATITSIVSPFLSTSAAGVDVIPCCPSAYQWELLSSPSPTIVNIYSQCSSYELILCSYSSLDIQYLNRIIIAPLKQKILKREHVTVHSAFYFKRLSSSANLFSVFPRKLYLQ